MTATPATESQIRYATELQNHIQYKIANIRFDREVMRPGFHPDRDTEPWASRYAEVRAIREAGDKDRAKELKNQLRADEQAAAEQAMDDYLTRRAELAETDLSTLDKDQMSSWIDAAKAHQI